MADDTENDAVATGQIGEAAHGPGASPHFPKGALDDIGGAHFLPMAFGNREKVQQAVEIALEAGPAWGRRSSQASFHWRKACSAWWRFGAR